MIVDVRYNMQRNTHYTRIILDIDLRMYYVQVGSWLEMKCASEGMIFM